MIWFMSAPSRSVGGHAHHRGQDPDMSTAAAEIAGERFARFGFRRPWILCEQRSRGHDHPVRAVAALGRLFGDERGLHSGQPLWCADTFERRDLTVLHARHRQLARAYRLAVDDDGTGAALAE